VLCAPTGYGLAHGVNEGEEQASENVVSAKNCPDADAVFKEASQETDGFRPGCPSSREARGLVEEIIE